MIKNINENMQSEFWKNSFGNDYIKRNEGKIYISSNIYLFSLILNRTKNVKTILEFGANIGNNLLAIENIFPESKLSGIEINENAYKKLVKNNFTAYLGSVLDFDIDFKRDLTFTRGLLIHIDPNYLNEVYTKLYNSSKKYICVIEYYNPTPVEVEYRGNKNVLFKRDFAGEILDMYPDVKLVDYGFCYHRDNNFVNGDDTWFLLEKN